MRAAVCVIAALALSGCGAGIVATVDTADQSAGLTVDGWGVSVGCKAGHICVQTPVAPLCFPVPSKVCGWVP